MQDNSKNMIAVLVSGGIDSAVLLGWAMQRFGRVYPVYVRCGMKWEKAELYWLKRFLARGRHYSLSPLQILESPVLDLHPDHWSVRKQRRVPDSATPDSAVFLPGRNLLLLSKVSVFCFLNKVGNIALGTLKGNPFRDSRPEFFRAFEKAIKWGTGRAVKIYAPFRKKSKAQVARMGKDLPLELTFSCLNPRGMNPCGQCNKCAERARVWAPA